MLQIIANKKLADKKSTTVINGIFSIFLLFKNARLGSFLLYPWISAYTQLQRKACRGREAVYVPSLKQNAFIDTL